jgi:sarcosine oxidase, subunit gamma
VRERAAAMGSYAPGHYGAAGSGVGLRVATIAAAWNVQGDARQSRLADAVRESFRIDLPLAPNTTVRSAALSALWLGPRSWLLVACGASPLVDYPAQCDAIGAAGGALFDVSAGRIAWTLAGPRAADVLAKGCPLDLHPRAFAPGACAQSLYGHIGILVVRHDDPGTFTLLAARSYARDITHLVILSAAQYGCDVLPPAPFALATPAANGEAAPTAAAS